MSGGNIRASVDDEVLLLLASKLFKHWLKSICDLSINVEYIKQQLRNHFFQNWVIGVNTGWVRKKFHRIWKIIKRNPNVLWLKYLYGSKAYYVFGVLWQNEIVWKSQFQDMSDWTLLP